jgi:hypothetical protein
MNSNNTAANCVVYIVLRLNSQNLFWFFICPEKNMELYRPASRSTLIVCLLLVLKCRYLYITMQYTCYLCKGVNILTFIVGSGQATEEEEDSISSSVINHFEWKSWHLLSFLYSVYQRRALSDAPWEIVRLIPHSILHTLTLVYIQQQHTRESVYTPLGMSKNRVTAPGDVSQLS